MQRIFTSYFELQTIIAGIKIRIFDEIKQGNNSIDKLSNKLNINKRKLRLFLTALEYLYLIESIDTSNNTSKEQRKELYLLTSRGALLTKDNPYSMIDNALFFGEEHYHAWNYLAETLSQKTHFNSDDKSGFEICYGKSFFDWLKHHPKRAQSIHNAFAFYAEKDYTKLFKKFKFPQYNLIMDVGGGLGIFLIKYLQKYPNTYGILLDLPDTIELAKKFIKKNASSLLNRIHFIKHDFFQPFSSKLTKLSQIPDVIILSRVIHDWNDQKAIKILKNCAEVLKQKKSPNNNSKKVATNQTSKIFIVDKIIKPKPNELQSFSDAFFPLNMMVIAGGIERTEKEFEYLLDVAGLFKENVIDLKTFAVIISSLKKI
ncbi:MAG: methyltransferase [Promethearchaeota archaeon]